MVYRRTVYLINATDPNKVWIPTVDLNMLLSANDGPIFICSDVAENAIVASQLGKANGYYGTIDNGVLTFPHRGIYIGFGGELSSYGNNNSMFRIIFPGAKVVDYSVDVKAGTSANGEIPVTFVLGDDIAKVKYAVYEGRLSESEAGAYVNKIAADQNAAFVTESSRVNLTLAATGIYTLVTANLDAEGAVQGTNYVSFGYVAEGDEVPVLVNAGLIVSDKYAPMGYTSENSAEYYIYGQDLKSVCYGLYKSSDVASQQQAVLQDLLSNGAASEAELAEINDGGLSDLFIGLSAGTDYTLLVYAENEYDYTLVMANASTGGVADPLQATYTIDDLYIGRNKEDFIGTYKYYAKTGDAAQRLPYGDVIISDGGSEETEDGVISYVNVKGLFNPAVNAGVIADDTVRWEAWTTNNGGCIIYSLANLFGPVQFAGSTYYAAQMTIMKNGAGGVVDNGFVAGITEEGNLAIVDSGLYDNYGGAVSLGFYLYANPDYTSGQGNFCIMSDMLLVEPSNISASSASEMSSDLGRVQMHIQEGEYNCVETVRTQVRRKIEEALAHKTLGKYSGAGLVVEREKTSVQFTAVPAAEPVCNSSAVVRNASNVLR